MINNACTIPRSRYNARQKRSHDLNPPPLPDLHMPAMPPHGLIRTIKSYLQAWRNRQWARELLAYDDHMLADLGYTRGELLWTLERPPTINAAAALRQRQRSRRKQWS